jgi:hypothetical protein
MKNGPLQINTLGASAPEAAILHVAHALAHACGGGVVAANDTAACARFAPTRIAA